MHKRIKTSGFPHNPMSLFRKAAQRLQACFARCSCNAFGTIRCKDLLARF